MAEVAVFGAGSYGTALGIQLARNGVATRLWGRDAAVIRAMADARENRAYLPGCTLPPALTVTAELAEAATAPLWLLAVPSHALAGLCRSLKPLLHSGVRVATASKGFEPDTGRLAHEVVAHELGAAVPVAIVSGPTFALEVGRGLPSAVTVASTDQTLANDVAEALHGPQMRAYTLEDVIGVAIGGSVKNVIAIAVGIADGMGMGANTRALLITRGLSEVMRLGEALGARRDTMMGLSGMGDLLLTCTDDQSRNRRFGKAIGQGQAAQAAIDEIGQVVEGVRNAVEVHHLAQRHGVDMPICEQVYRVLHEKLPPQQALAALAARPQRAE